jgi:M6 family metalloprotease-like protein
MKRLQNLSGVRHSVVTLLLLLLVTAAAAIPAKPGLRQTITLTDGTTVSAVLMGDEYGHYWLADDGTAYQATTTDAARFAPVSLSAVKGRAAVRRQAADQHRMKRLPARRGFNEMGNYVGEKKGLIILVNFKDKTFNITNNKALYQRIANEPNFKYGKFKGSMYDYFYAQSGQQFMLTFDVLGPVTVSQKCSYYGQNDSQGNDKYPATMVIEALKMVDDEVNFADYDWDGDGEVDQVYVVYAGKGEADGGTTSTIWPHEYTLSEAAEYGDGDGVQTLDGVTIDTYACGPELDGGSGSIAGIGTMCHEFSHCLGFPDFYDTDYSGGQGMFEWDLMDTGSYNGGGYLPAGYTSYERWMAGWMTPIELSASTTVTEMKSLQDGGEAYVVYNNGHRDEFFLLENRQLTGWDASIPGEGLLILHVDYDAAVWDENEVNGNPSRQRMTWIAADNQYQYEYYMGTKYYSTEGAANDPFPYGSVNAFNRSTTPAAKFNNKNSDGTYYLDSSIEQITRNGDGTMSFRFVGTSNVQAPTFTPKPGRYEEAQSVSISCATEGTTIYYTTDGSAPTAQSTLYTAPITVSQTTTIKAVAVSTDGEESAVATAKYTIGGSSSNPATKTFQLLTSTDEVESGLRYIIACGSKQTAAGQMNGLVLGAADIDMDDDMATIDSEVAVFILEEADGDGWSLRNEATGQYLIATDVKKLAYADEPAAWTLDEGTSGVTLSFGTCGTMLYNVFSPRFTTYTSKPTASMIQANLFMEYSAEVPVEKQDVTMSFDPDAVTMTEGDTFEQPTLTTSPAGLAVSYESSNESVATVDAQTGAVTIAGTGTTVVTATFAGDDNYKAGTASYTLTVKKKAAPAGDDSYQLVTDAATLAEGNQVLIAYIDGNGNALAMGITQNANNRAAVEVTLNDDNTLTPGDDAQVVTLENSGEHYLLYVGDGYLYAASSTKNWLRTEEEADDNAYATIDISEGEATISFQGSYERNTVRFNPNNGTPIFSCYAPTSSTGALPAIYRKVGAVEPTGVTTVGSRPAENSYYDLQGRRVEKPLRRGVYIVQGRKVVY